MLANTSNIVGCYMLRPFAHPVACCCVLLGVVAQCLKPVKLLAACKRTQQLPTLLANNIGSCCVHLHAGSKAGYKTNGPSPRAFTRSAINSTLIDEFPSSANLQATCVPAPACSLAPLSTKPIATAQ